MMPPLGKTKDGFELQFGVNHLGHFVLTSRLLDTLVATPGARVANVSSSAHNFGRIDFENLSAEVSYSPRAAYGQSKLANLLFTYELQRRLRETGRDTLAVAAHPGWTATNLQRHSSLFSFLNNFFAQSAEMGALPTLRAATDPDVGPAEYYGPAGRMQMVGHPVKVESNGRSHDLETAARLWQVSEEMTEVAYETTLAEAA
jgi:NAD(P)-dependent dehydrogenase (short-subunit alcohol dehydrogenase family)